MHNDATLSQRSSFAIKVWSEIREKTLFLLEDGKWKGSLHRSEKAQNELEGSRKDFVSFTDPESRFMPNKKHSSKFSYNPQVTVDAEHGIVVAEDVVQNVRDVDQLKPQRENR